MLKKRFFEKNRANFMAKMKNGSLAVFFSKGEVRKGDSVYFDFCDVNIFYLSGIEQAKTKLILYKDKSGNSHEFIFVQKSDKKTIVWEGEKLSRKRVKIISGIENIFYLGEFEAVFSNLIDSVGTLYIRDKKKSAIFDEYDEFIIKTRNKHNLQFEIYLPILCDIREIKSKEEIKEIKKALEITKIGFEKVLSCIDKMENEKEVEALLGYEYTKRKARHSYHPIVASGSDACILHYIQNDKAFNRNDLVLIDSGAEINNYKADITRTFPVSGKFTKRQKEVYSACLDVQKFAISRVKIGVLKKEWEKDVLEYMTDKLIELGVFTKKHYNRNKAIVRKYYPHSVGHFLGLDTHDIGNYDDVFKEGQVITVEPGIYIKKEGVGVRIEDNILITRKGCKVLSNNILKEVDEIERMIRVN